MNATTKTRKKVSKGFVFVACLAPLGWIAYLVLTGQAGANPIEAANRFLGDWALRFLILVLAITPIRKITGWNDLARFRRMIGLYAFAYAVFHVTSYLGRYRQTDLYYGRHGLPADAVAARHHLDQRHDQTPGRQTVAQPA